ncbi:hypothetical protein LCGC14_1107730 [marine sediment metagenome]|uniref:Uncharacterized protein n=1 Tax=marine sediment metagenome TaxID=412755 RepID=A0A0F9MVI9_9ZZZZ
MGFEDTVMSTQDAIDAYEDARLLYEKAREEDELPVSVSQADNAGMDGHSRAQAGISFKAGYDKRESEFVYNPDYLNFQKGIKTGRELGRQQVVEWLERQRFAEPQNIPEHGRKPVIITLDEDDLAELKEWGLDNQSQ